MSQTVNFDTVSIKQIIDKLQQLEDLKLSLLASIPERALKSGSRLWWDKVEQMADSDIKRGNVRKFKNIKSLINDLNA